VLSSDKKEDKRGEQRKEKEEVDRGALRTSTTTLTGISTITTSSLFDAIQAASAR